MKQAMVLGGGISGKAATRLLRRLGYTVTIYDQRPIDPGAHDLASVSLVSGPWSDVVVDGVDLVVTSPGFAPSSPPIRDIRRRGIPLIGETELALRHLKAPVVAVTGTNGKTTVTEMISAMLTASGLRAPAVGNIGDPASDLVGQDLDIVVLEASSFQLYYCETLHPRVAVLLNLAPDHLDWHESFAEYAAAKGRIFRRQEPSDLLIIDADDAGANHLAADAPSTVVGVSGRRLPAGGAGADGDVLRLPSGTVPLADLALSDPIYVVDIAAAGVAAHAIGTPHSAIAEVATSFTPGAHRRTLIGVWDGVQWVNDSKASNPHAAVAAISSYPSVVLIAGGRNKGLDLAPMMRVPTLRHVIVLGEAAVELVAAAAEIPVAEAATMADAVALADAVARPGDTVLLSPGCASFDMFQSYAERGEVFTAEVRTRKEAA